MNVTRRTFLGASAAALAAAGNEKPRLGCATMIYGKLPFDEAVAHIRKAGFRFICPAEKHAGELVCSPQMSAAQRRQMLRHMKDLGVEPIVTLGGFAAEPVTPEGLETFKGNLEVCADFGMHEMVGAGPWYFKTFPTEPKRQSDWAVEIDRFCQGLEKAIRHAEKVGVTICLKPHTGFTARAKDCLDVVKRFGSERLKIAWDAGNVSFYEGIYPDPDLPDLAPHVKALCIKDHLGRRGEENFPTPGEGNVDHEAMFKTLFAAGFNGPMEVERVDGKDGNPLPPEVADARLAKAYKYLTGVLKDRAEY